MDEIKPRPKAQPPAWPVDVGNTIRWVAVGPFGLLPVSFTSPAKARDAALAAFEEMWALQAERNEGRLDDLRLARTGDQVGVPFCPDRQVAIWVNKGGDRLLAVYDEVSGIVQQDGYLSEDELFRAMDNSTDFSE